MLKRARHVYEFGPFRLIPEERQLLRDGEPVALTPKAFDLLVVLVENGGHLVEKEELIRRVWADRFVEEANLSVNISALRRALGEGANDNDYVETVPRRGYRFVAEVRERSDGASPDTPPVPADDTAQVHPRQRWPIFAVVTAAAILILALLVPAVRERFSSSTRASRVDSIAIVPFENASGDRTQDYFADGMTDALVTELAGVGTLRLVSRAPAGRDSRPTASPGRIASDLGVDAVLSGSVRRNGDDLEVDVKLFDAKSGRIRWAETYRRDAGEMAALERELTHDTIRATGRELAPESEQKLAGVARVKPEAYDAWLRGQFYLHRQTRESVDAAIAALESAVRIDPSFAAAHAELAQAYVWKLFLFAPKEARWSERAFVESEKALALDPGLAVAYLARGRLLWTPANHFPHENAIREYRRALARNPSLDEARNQLALIYCHIGAFDEALRESRTAVLINPGNALAQFRTAQTLNFQGKHEEALAALRSLPSDVNPALIGQQVVWALYNLGRTREASDALAQLLRENPKDEGGLFTSLGAMLAASAGEKQTAETRIAEAVKRGEGFGHFHHTAYHIACAYALMNDRGAAVKWLQLAADDGFPCYPLFARDPNLRNLREDPRFIAFMTSMKKQWEQYDRFVKSGG